MLLDTQNHQQVHHIRDYDIISPTKLLDVESPSTDPATMMITTSKDPTDATMCASRLASAPFDEHKGDCSMLPPTPVSPCSSIETPISTPTISVTGRYSNIEHKYHIDPRVLGTGHHGSVRECIDPTTGQRFAVKSIRKADPSVKSGQLRREVVLLDEMKHSNIIRLVDVYEDEENLHLVTDLCQGGELFDRIIEKASSGSNGCFSEYQAAKIIYQILSAISYMHKHNIVHRDIKPENILFETKDEDSPIKVIDFGLARKHFAEEGEPPMKTIVGTPYYIAPDVLHKRGYGKACDLWSVGVIAYILICGYPPFNGETNKATYDAISRGVYRFPFCDWKHVSDGAKNFISRLLQLDPRNRMNAEEAMRHPWIASQLRGEQAREVVFKGYSIRDSIFSGRNVNQTYDQIGLSS